MLLGSRLGGEGAILISIRQAIEKVLNGQLRIPAFQRGFVWDADLVAYLMDSIYKNFPFGSLILWRTKSQLRTERQLGPFTLPDRDPDYPIDYVLDGQQRLTSIFGVFQTDIDPDPQADVGWTRVFYDFEAQEDLQESRFVSVEEDKLDPARHFPIGSFFDPVEYRQATDSLNEDRVREIDSVQAVFKEATIPIQLIETDDRAKVAIVFERVNRLGVELDTFQLLSAWTWSEDFDLQERFRDLSEELEPFGFAEIGSETNLLLRCCSAVVVNDVSAPSLLSLNGAEVRERFAEIENGLRGAIDFLRTNLHVQKLDNLPHAAALVPLTVFFAAPEGEEISVTDTQRDELLRWFWRSSFARRFSGAVLRNLKRDLTEAKSLRKTGEPGLAAIPASIDAEWFIENQFTIGAVNTKTFILLLAQQPPLSFVSGNPVSLQSVLQAYNRTEFHHLFPRAYLQGNGFKSPDINRLVNFAFLSRSDNRALGGVAPSSYRGRIPKRKDAEILARALVPESLFQDDYGKFMKDRSELLADEAAKRAGLSKH